MVLVLRWQGDEETLHYAVWLKLKEHAEALPEGAMAADAGEIWVDQITVDQKWIIVNILFQLPR